MIDSYDPFVTLISPYILGGICEVRSNTSCWYARPTHGKAFRGLGVMEELRNCKQYIKLEVNLACESRNSTHKVKSPSCGMTSDRPISD